MVFFPSFASFWDYLCSPHSCLAKCVHFSSIHRILTNWTALGYHCTWGNYASLVQIVLILHAFGLCLFALLPLNQFIPLCNLCLVIFHLPYFMAHEMHFFPEKCDLNLTCVLCAGGKYYFQTYKYPYSYYITSLSWDSEICFQIMRSGITACERLTFL
jgi:hypothetical protein